MLFHDMRVGNAKNKAGYAKIVGSCEQARRDGLNYIRTDTCCIDKSSSAELTEAINSIYRWYQNAHVCYAYASFSARPSRHAQPFSACAQAKNAPSQSKHL